MDINNSRFYNNKCPPIRVFPKFKEDLKNILLTRADKRLSNPLNKREMSFIEATELITRTNAWKNVIEELNTKPKRKDVTP